MPTALAIKRANQGGATIIRDKASGNPYFKYNENGGSGVVWYQDAQMLADRLDLVKKYKLKGIAVWRMGFEEDKFWKTLDQRLGPAR